MMVSAAKRRELENSILYSEELGIDLARGGDEAYFRWFLASVLFGARISQTTAKNTYRAFVHHGLTDPKKIVAAGWDFLVATIMREGGYVRYDGRKSTQILRDCDRLLAEYGGSLSRLHDSAGSPREVEKRLSEFYGVGPVTVNIFLRELRPFWRNAAPAPLPEVVRLAHELNIDLSRYDEKTMAFARLEAGLIRLLHEKPKAAAGEPAPS